MRSLRAACFVFALILLASCAGGPEQVTSQPTPSHQKTPGSVGRHKPQKPTSKGETTKDDGSTTSQGEDKNGNAGEGEEPPSDEDFTEGSSEDDNSSALAPAAGTYTFEQSGYEEFCGTGCERSRLPDTATEVVEIQRRGDGAVALTSEMRASDDRLVRSTFVYTSEEALITYVYARFSYESITLTEEYEPDPAVSAFHFPLEVGDRWSGHWDAKVSGNYGVTVAGREQVTVAGATVSAFKILTHTTFSGEYEGTADLTAWFDPATRSVVATAGDVDLRSNFGRYHTRFDTRLRSGPGYR